MIISIISSSLLAVWETIQLSSLLDLFIPKNLNSWRKTQKIWNQEVFTAFWLVIWVAVACVKYDGYWSECCDFQSWLLVIFESFKLKILTTFSFSKSTLHEGALTFWQPPPSSSPSNHMDEHHHLITIMIILIMVTTILITTTIILIMVTTILIIIMIILIMVTTILITTMIILIMVTTSTSLMSKMTIGARAESLPRAGLPTKCQRRSHVSHSELSTHRGLSYWSSSSSSSSQSLSSSPKSLRRYHVSHSELSTHRW